MKKYFYLMMAAVAGFTMTSCDAAEDAIDDIVANDLATPAPVAAAVGEDSATITWDAVANATTYAYTVNDGDEQTTTETSISLTDLEAETTYTVKVKAQYPGSIYFNESDYGSVSFTTTSIVIVYRIASFADDWDTYYYDFNDDGTVDRVYRLWDGELDKEWVFAYSGTSISVTGSSTYAITLNDAGYVATLNDGSNDYAYTYDENGYMIEVSKNDSVISSSVIEDGNIMSWSKLSDGETVWKDHTYSSSLNIARVHCIYSESCGFSRWLAETNLMGEASVNCHATNKWDYSDTSSVFSFEYDSNNCISQEIKDYDGYIENFFYTYTVVE